MQQSHSRRLSAKLKTSLLLLVLALIAITTATYAWFTITTAGKVNEMSLQVTTGDKLGLSTSYQTDITQYENTITTEMVDNKLKAAFGYTVGLADLKLAPLTSGNGKQLYTRGANKAQNPVASSAESDRNYLELELWVMGTREMYVYLTTEDSATGAGDGTLIQGDTAKNGGTQNRVAEAVRLSFTVYTDGTGNAQDTQYGKLIYEPQKQTAVALSGQAAKDGGSTQDTFDLAGGDKLLFRLEANAPRRVVLRLWLEGEDPQCTNGQMGINIENAWLNARLRFVAKDENGIELS